MATLDLVAWDDPDAAALRVAQQAELRERYGEDDIGHAMTGESIVATYGNGTPSRPFHLLPSAEVDPFRWTVSWLTI